MTRESGAQTSQESYGVMDSPKVDSTQSTRPRPSATSGSQLRFGRSPPVAGRVPPVSRASWLRAAFEPGKLPSQATDVPQVTCANGFATFVLKRYS